MVCGWSKTLLLTFSTPTARLNAITYLEGEMSERWVLYDQERDCLVSPTLYASEEDAKHAKDSFALSVCLVIPLGDVGPNDELSLTEPPFWIQVSGLRETDSDPLQIEGLGGQYNNWPRLLGLHGALYSLESSDEQEDGCELADYRLFASSPIPVHECGDCGFYHFGEPGKGCQHYAANGWTFVSPSAIQRRYGVELKIIK